MFFDLGSYAPTAALLLLAGVFAAFVMEKQSAEVVAFIGAIMALILGLVTIEDILAAISNPAPATIGVMFFLSAALVRTGALETMIAWITRLSARGNRLATVTFFVTAAGASAFLNNTPVVIVLIPVAFGLAKQLGTVPQRLLMPLSFMVILGGTVTLIGTSTNLLVDGVARDLGMAPFGLFEIAPLGLIVALVGGGFLAVAAPRLLPQRDTVSSLTASRETRSWLADLFIPAGSSLIGAPPLSLTSLTHGGGRVIDVIRGDASLRRDLAAVRLQAGDTIVVKTRDVEVMGFREGATRGVTLPEIETGQLRPLQLVEALVVPESKAIGRRLGKMRWRRRFGVYPLALHRKGEAMGSRLEDTPLGVGDMLLLEGAAEDIERLIEDQRLITLGPKSVRAFRRGKAPVTISVLIGVVLLAAFNVAPILPLALIGVALVLAAGCIEVSEGLAALDGRLLLLIVSMLVLGTALDHSGAIERLVEAVAPMLVGTNPWLALAIIYVVTSILTELVTNSAVAVLLTPIAFSLAVSLGVDPRPFLVAVMFGASASFATPIGYQTNTLVYNAGGYRFTDFLRVGLPMNILIGATSVLVIPFFWPM